MQNIRLNLKNTNTKAKDISQLRKEFGFEDSSYISVINGYASDKNQEIHPNDNIFFIKKSELPSAEIMKAIMISRNSDNINKALNNAVIGIAGLGGLGSNVALFLARAGVKKLVIVDFDKVDISNLNRQQYNILDIGKPKSQALKEIIKNANPFVEVEDLNIEITKENINEIFKDCQIVAECFDNPKAKAMFANSILNKTAVLASGMAGFGLSNDIKTQKLAKNFYICGDLKSEVSTTNSLFAPRVAICAAHQANLILELLFKENDIN